LASVLSTYNSLVSFHGSWDKIPSTGYKVVTVPGTVASNGAWAPTGVETSTTAYSDLFYNKDETMCSTGCFRPVGLSWSPLGDLYVSSDVSGEIFILRRTGGTTTTTSSHTTTITSHSTTTTRISTTTTSIRTTTTTSHTTTSSKTSSASGPTQTEYGQW
jgi:hypothetical protein